MDLLTVVFLVVLYLAIKMGVASENQIKILNAIDYYTSDTLDFQTGIELLDAMEDFDDTVFRLWDWGYKRILPKQYFELIKPYIK